MKIALFLSILGAALALAEPCVAQSSVRFGIGVRAQNRHGGVANLGIWREGAPPTGVLAREFGNTLTGLAPYVLPIAQTIVGGGAGSLVDPTGGDNESADREACEDIEVPDNDPKLEERRAALAEIRQRQDGLLEKLGITGYEPRLKPVQVVAGDNGGVGEGLDDPLDD
ncbi:hypothetical protein LOC72_10850 [Roseiconus lacunae]|nr:hypothetical protein [Roseiconus lacunae]